MSRQVSLLQLRWFAELRFALSVAFLGHSEQWILSLSFFFFESDKNNSFVEKYKQEYVGQNDAQSVCVLVTIASHLYNCLLLATAERW